MASPEPVVDQLYELKVYADTIKNLRKDIKTRESLISAYLALPGKAQRAEFVDHIDKTIPRATFYRWVNKYKAKGKAALAHKKRADAGDKRKELSPELQVIAEAYLMESGEFNVTEAIRRIINVHDETASDYLIRRWVKEAGIRDKWYNWWHKQKARTLFPSVHHGRGINPPVIWYVDDHDQDCLVYSQDDEGNEIMIRPKTIRVLQPECNMIVGYSITDRAYGGREIKLAILNAIMKWKVIPEQIFIEADKRMQESGNLQGLEFLGIKVITVAYAPTNKLEVEASFKADRLELDATFRSYISNRPSNRPDKAELRIEYTFEEYCVKYNNFCEYWNFERLSVYRGKDKQTPVEMWNNWIKKGWNPKRIDKQLEHDLPFMFSKYETRVLCGGELTFTIDGIKQYYTGACLMSIPEGTEIGVRRNFLDPRYAYAYWGKKRLGTIELIERIGYGYGEYSNEATIQMIRNYKLLRKKYLAKTTDFSPYIESYIKYAEEKAKERKTDTILLPDKLIAFIREQTINPLDASEEINQQQLNAMGLDFEYRHNVETQVETGHALSLQSEPGISDDEIAKYLEELEGK